MSSSSYDYCFAIRDLENDLLKLVTFEASQHSQAFIDKSQPAIYTYIPWEPFKAVSEMALQLEKTRGDGVFFFAVFDKKLHSEPTLAGIISLMNSSVTHLCTEIGYVVTLPEFHRTHVTTNAVGLLLHYCLDLPEAGGLGLRRVQWQTSSNNQKSVATGKRLGFQWEGIQRWSRVLPTSESKLPASNGIKVRGGDPRNENPGRDTAVLSMCWNDWEEGGRKRVDELMKSRS